MPATKTKPKPIKLRRDTGAERAAQSMTMAKFQADLRRACERKLGFALRDVADRLERRAGAVAMRFAAEDLAERLADLLEAKQDPKT